MPCYCYRNIQTDKMEHIVMTVAEKDKREIFVDGRKAMDLGNGQVGFRDIVFEQRGVRHYPGNWPMESDALGVGHDQVAEATAAATKSGCPTEFTSDGSAILTGPKHRAKLAKSLGLHDRNAGYSDPTP
jgi:hypothetical protein